MKGGEIMRRSLVLLGAFILAVLPLAGMQATVGAYAAPQHAHLMSFTGRLVATLPSGTRSAPQNLVLQVGNRAMLVRASNQTQIVNRDSVTVSSGDLRTGALLDVTGVFRGAAFTVSRIQDLSLPVAINVTAQGKLASIPSPGVLCLARMLGIRIPGRAILSRPGFLCLSDQFPIFIVSGTQIVNRNGSPVALNTLVVGDFLQVTGSLTNGRITASMIKDMTTQRTTTALVGTLVGTPASLNRSQPINLLLQVGSQTLLVRTISSTLILDHSSRVIPLNALRNGAVLRVTGSFVNGQLDALIVQDLSV
jgi:hypothetical protein